MKYAVSWIGLVVLAIINGVIREKGYAQFMNELSAHQLSTLIGIALLGLFIWILTGVWRIESAKQAYLIGAIWLILTIVFEFLFGHYVMSHPWSKLLHDYSIFKGRIWIFVLIWTAIAPYLFYKIRA
jgi:hypothetical protein